MIGPGSDLLAGQLARMGFDVTGPTGLDDPRHLPFGDMDFDVAYYADTFGITHDLDGVVAEAARVVRDGGTVLYDTVRRARKGTISDDELVELAGMHLGPEGKAGPVTYLGFATETRVAEP